MRTQPPTFAGSASPIEVDDWLKDIHRKLRLVRVNAQDRVKYVAHQLKGVAANWWANYCEARDDAEGVMCNEFAEASHTAHIPASLMELKRYEFRALVQRKMSVSEDWDSFTQLSRYRRGDIPTEADKIAKFLRGLDPGLKDRLVSHDFANFQNLVNKTILQGNSKMELEECRNRKAPQGQYGAGSSR
ncbi:hypothetical protein ACQ4PT_004171 [Festuca glaucescens]